jgi:6-pyruvoyltetrahydropterin/6-carboxytetrahydropterin synthase
VIVRRTFEFEAAHRLPEHPGKCRELHGHSYRLVVAIERAVEPQSGMAIDFGDLKRVVSRDVIELVDHRSLNDLIDNPTAERIAEWMWRRLHPELPGLVEIELHETRSCSVVYRGD